MTRGLILRNFFILTLLIYLVYPATANATHCTPTGMSGYNSRVVWSVTSYFMESNTWDLVYIYPYLRAKSRHYRLNGSVYVDTRDFAVYNSWRAHSAHYHNMSQPKVLGDHWATDCHNTTHKRCTQATGSIGGNRTCS